MADGISAESMKPLIDKINEINANLVKASEDIELGRYQVEYSAKDTIAAISEVGKSLFSALEGVRIAVLQGIDLQPSPAKIKEQEQDKSEENSKLRDTIEDVADAINGLKEKKDEKIELPDWLSGIFNSLNKYAIGFGAILGLATGLMQGYIQSLVRINKALGRIILGGLNKIGSLFTTALSKLSDLFVKGFPNIAKKISGYLIGASMQFDLLKDSVSGWVKRVVSVFDGGVDFVKGLVSEVADSKLFKSAKNAIDWISNTFAKVVGTIESVAGSVKANLFDPITELFAKFRRASTMVSGPMGEVSKVITGIVDSVKSFVSGVSGAFGKVSGLLGKAFSAFKLIGKVVAWPLTVIMAIWDTVKGAIEGFEKDGIVGAVGGAIKGLVESIITGPLDLVKDLVSWIAEKLGFEDFSGFLDSFSFTDLFGEAVDKVVGFFKGIFSSIGDAVENFEIGPIELGFGAWKKTIGPWKPFGSAEAPQKDEKPAAAVNTTTNATTIQNANSNVTNQANATTVNNAAGNQSRVSNVNNNVANVRPVPTSTGTVIESAQAARPSVTGADRVSTSSEANMAARDTIAPQSTTVVSAPTTTVNNSNSTTVNAKRSSRLEERSINRLIGSVYA